jgi:hypothetical protein
MNFIIQHEGFFTSVELLNTGGAKHTDTAEQQGFPNGSGSRRTVVSKPVHVNLAAACRAEGGCCRLANSGTSVLP